MQRIAGRSCAAGWAITVWNPRGQNTMLRYALEASRPGDFLVVTTPVDGAAQWGDLAHEWAGVRGLAGVLVDGSVRDVAALRQLGLSVWARSIDPRQPAKQALGYVNAPVCVGGLQISQGDLVVADDDAVMVLTPGRVHATLRAASRRAEHEGRVREGTRRGEPWPEPANGPPFDQITRVATPWTEPNSTK
jgi:4-hydroxy-4-methyl-2-oxoglutarate aldolase